MTYAIIMTRVKNTIKIMKYYENRFLPYRPFCTVVLYPGTVAIPIEGFSRTPFVSRTRKHIIILGENAFDFKNELYNCV